MERRVFSKNLFLGTSAFLTQGFFTLPYRKLNILILGGTNFVGPAIVEYGRRRGHEIFLFNRGITNPHLFPELVHFKGDREKGLEGYRSLADKFWDVIIDTWPTNSKLVADATNFLKTSTKHYFFISSVSVYANIDEKSLNENDDTVDLPEDVNQWTYAEHKKRAENIVREAFPRNHTIFRPGPIKGWRDPSNDLAYWLVRIRRGDTILGPGDGSDPVQFIDVKDLSRFIIHCAEENFTGTFNTTGPQNGKRLVWDELLRLAQKKINKDARIVWNSAEFLRKNAVQPMWDMPLWMPEGKDQGLMQISAIKAFRYGLQFRPVSKTFADTLEWFDLNYGDGFEFGKGGEQSPGLPIQLEKELIDTIS